MIRAELVSDRLDGYEIVLGVTGGIAAYKSAQLCSGLVQQGAGVTVVLTEHAQAFVGEVTFRALSGRRVYRDLFEGAGADYQAEHIRLTGRADLVVVAPATANILGKMAGGICDDLLSTLLCSVESPVLMAPAMNERMWGHAAIQRNVACLKKDGVLFVGPGQGRLACGSSGVGRMSEPEEILEQIRDLLLKNPPKKEAG